MPHQLPLFALPFAKSKNYLLTPKIQIRRLLVLAFRLQWSILPPNTSVGILAGFCEIHEGELEMKIQVVGCVLDKRVKVGEVSIVRGAGKVSAR